MDGILIVDKPAGMTSHDVVARVRRILRTKRVGHTGTLDPFATGVLVVLVGKATRLAKYLDQDKKAYSAEIQFGFETDTGDLTGTRKGDTAEAAEALRGRLDGFDLEPILENFRGKIGQVPPMYSAKKVAGKKLYELARQGKEIERRPLAVTIHQLTVADGSKLTSDGKLTIDVVCSAGTYIRVLAEDIGKAVGVGAHLTLLRRTASGRYDLGRAVDLELLEKVDAPEQLMLPAVDAVAHLPEFVLTDRRVGPTRNGLSTRTDGALFVDGDDVRMTSPDGTLVAIGRFDKAENVIQPKLVLS